MNFKEYGKKKYKTLLFIHGMASTAQLCFEPLLKYLNNYHVVLVEVDGHSDNTKEDLKSLASCCDCIEKYINDNFDGHIFGLCGFSMGATMSVELIGRGNIKVDKVFLDAAFTVKMGLFKSKLYTFCFVKAIERLQKGKKIPKFLIDSIMGKDNNSVIEMLYNNITANTIINVCKFVYKYDIPYGLKNFKNPVMFIRGTNERYPKKSARILKKYLPQLKEKVYHNMGHGQYLHEHSAEYARDLLNFLEQIH